MQFAIPAEPAPQGAQYRHLNWPGPPLPLVTVAFGASAFSDTKKDQAAAFPIAGGFFGKYAQQIRTPAGVFRMRS